MPGPPSRGAGEQVARPAAVGSPASFDISPGWPSASCPSRRLSGPGQEADPKPSGRQAWYVRADFSCGNSPAVSAGSSGDRNTVLGRWCQPRAARTDITEKDPQPRQLLLDATAQERRPQLGRCAISAPAKKFSGHDPGSQKAVLGTWLSARPPKNTTRPDRRGSAAACAEPASGVERASFSLSPRRAVKCAGREGCFRP